MQKERLNAFSDGVFAIIITIMVLELKPPHGAEWADLAKLAPVFLSYVLSFLYVAIYWNNHHHMMHSCGRVSAAILWSNTHLLFWLSLIPFATAWMDENHFAPMPTAVYGFSLLMPAIAFLVHYTVLVRAQGEDSVLSRVASMNLKAKISPLLYLVAIGFAFVATWVSFVIFAVVASMWVIPDKGFEELDASTEAG